MTEFTKYAQAAQAIIRCANRMDRSSVHSIAYFLNVAGAESRFYFKLGDRGPRSDDLDEAINAAFYLGMINVESRISDATIRSFLVAEGVDNVERSDDRLQEIAARVVRFERSDLEFAATGAYLSKELEGDDRRTYSNRMKKMEKMANGNRQRVLDALDRYNRLWETMDREEALPKPAVKIEEMKDESRSLVGSQEPLQ